MGNAIVLALWMCGPNMLSLGPESPDILSAGLAPHDRIIAQAFNGTILQGEDITKLERTKYRPTQGWIARCPTGVVHLSFDGNVNIIHADGSGQLTMQQGASDLGAISAISIGEECVLALSAGGNLIVIDSKTGKVHRRVPDLDGMQHVCLAGGDLMFVAEESGEIRVMSGLHETPPRVISACGSPIRSLAGNRNYFAVASGTSFTDHTVRIHRTSDLSVVKEFKVPVVSNLSQMSISNDGTLITYSDELENCYAVDVDMEITIQQIPGEACPDVSTRLSRDGTRVLSIQGGVLGWLSTKEKVITAATNPLGGPVTDVVFRMNREIVVQSNAGATHLFGRNRNRNVGPFSLLCSLSRSGVALTLNNQDGKLYMRALDTHWNTQVESRDTIRCAAYSDDPHLAIVATYHSGKTLAISRDAVREIKGLQHARFLTASNGTAIALSFGDPHVFRCDLDTLNLSRYMGCGLPTDIVLSPTGAHAIVFYEDHPSEMLSFQTGEFTPIEVLSHVAAIDDFRRRYYPIEKEDSSQEVYMQSDKGRVLAKIPCRSCDINCLRVSPDGNSLAIGFINGIVDIADISLVEK